MSSEVAEPFRVEQIDHVELFVPSRREAAGWYRRVLGLEIIPEFERWSKDPGGPLMVATQGGGSKLALFRGSPQDERETVGFRRVAFRTDGAGFLRFLERLPGLGLRDDRGREVQRELVSDHGLAFSIYFSDPWGHRFELTSYDHEPVRRALTQD